MERRYCVAILLCTILSNYSIVSANYYEQFNSNETDNTNINQIPHSHTNNNTDSHLLKSFLPSESLQNSNNSENYHVNDNNDLDNSLNRLHHQKINSDVHTSSNSSSEIVDSSVIVDNYTMSTIQNGAAHENPLGVAGESSGNFSSGAETENSLEHEESHEDAAVVQRKVKELALKALSEIFGLNTPQTGSQSVSVPPPEFMVDLYNTITDSYGVTRAKNPYDANIVRSLAEQDNSLNDFFYFNIPILDESEIILEAELHIHRLQTPHDQLHPSLYLTPFYILSLYQVLDPKNLAIPDLHKLLGVHYVPALGSGWEVFNVKQSVLNWMGGQVSNHGFLVAATSLGGDRVPVIISRRAETRYSKQPILVLFTQDSNINKMNSTPSTTVQKSKLSQNVVKVDTNASSRGNGTEEEELVNIPTSSLENPRFHHALLFKDSIRHPNSVNRFRSRRSKNQTESRTSNTTDTIIDPLHFRRNLTACSRHDLFVNFEDIGWSTSVIAPKGYNAFYCDGPCAFPMDQMMPSNHATVQSIVHQLNLSPGLSQPCCVPTTLLPISLLYYDDEYTVVLKQYPQMVAESCGCS